MSQSQSRAQFGIDASWLSDTIRECQAFLGESVSLVPSDLRATAGRFIERLPVARTPLETLVQKGLLLDLAIQFGYAAHKAFHRHASPSDRSSRRCAFQPSASLGEWPHDSTRSPAEAFHRWASRFGFELQTAHPQACVHGAEYHLKQHYQDHLAIDELAQHLRCSPAYLQRTFKDVTGFTLREYQAELRLREALRLLETSGLKIEAIAGDVGYRSKKDLYRVVQARVGCTPLEFRKRKQASGVVRCEETAHETAARHGVIRQPHNDRQRRGA
ncbi:MAG: AraC family transcriptional regulator [Vicinamibacterales bacterium]|nr:AraC family transcriptional regulator [Vicinamibacterales bacterium]